MQLIAVKVSRVIEPGVFRLVTSTAACRLPTPRESPIRNPEAGGWGDPNVATHARIHTKTTIFGVLNDFEGERHASPGR
jgi:hypothetical protein